MRLLLAEDDPLLGDGLKAGLERAGFTVEWVRDGVAAGLALETASLDAAILDLGLPRRDGIEVLRALRAGGSDLPVLVLSARDTLDERVYGLDTGADDYLVKPFDLEEVTARLRAIIRRRNGRASPLLVHGDLALDPAGRTVTRNGEAVPVVGRELSLLEALLNNAGRVMTRDRLEEVLYGWDEGVESNALEVYIHNLRKKLGRDLIRTVRGVGYLIPRERHDGG